MVNNTIITNNGRKIMINRISKDTPDYSIPANMRAGINQEDVEKIQTALTEDIPLKGLETGDDCDAITGWSANGTNTISLNTTNGEFKEGTGCLNIIKSDTSSVDIEASKTITSLDFTDKKIWCWVYLDETDVYDELETTGAITLRYGSDSSNYYYKTFNKSDLIAGWNPLYFSVPSATGTTGTPTITACDYFYIKLTTTDATDVWVEKKVRLDYIRLASNDDYILTNMTGYPSVDETNHEVSRKYHLPTTSGNGFFINGFSVENTDSTILTHSLTKFGGDSKSNTDEWMIIVKDKIGDKK